MDSLKHSDIADGAGWLYRSAFHMAQGDKKLAIEMFELAQKKIGDHSLIDLKKAILILLLGKDIKKEKIIAEKILDEYQKMMFTLMSQLTV